MVQEVEDIYTWELMEIHIVINADQEAQMEVMDLLFHFRNLPHLVEKAREQLLVTLANPQVPCILLVQMDLIRMALIVQILIQIQVTEQLLGTLVYVLLDGLANNKRVPQRLLYRRE